MQHVSSDDVKNGEASEDGDCPRLERWRWSPGVGAIGNCHIQIAFLYAFEAKLFVLIAPADGTPLLPTAGFKIGCCPSASSWGERYRWVDSRAIRQMSYFVVGQEANVERPCAAAGGGAGEISAETQSQP
jgi:hypothetical protein